MRTHPDIRLLITSPLQDVDLLQLARFGLYKTWIKRRSSHAPNLIAALSSTQEQRLTRIKFDKCIRCDKCIRKDRFCRIKPIFHLANLFARREAKTRIRQRGWLKFAGEKIRCEQVGSVPTFLSVRANKFGKWKIGFM